MALDYWQATRQATTVVAGTVTAITPQVQMTVTTALKGQAYITTVAFEQPLSVKPSKIRDHDVPAPVFAIGETWLVFLKENDPPLYTLQNATRNIHASIVQTVKEVQELDALPDDREKCRRCVQLICLSDSLSRGYAGRELTETYNRAEFVDFLLPLLGCSPNRDIFVRLMAENPHPSTTGHLRRLLQKESNELLPVIISGLQRKNPADDGLSVELLAFLTHPEPRVRESALYAMKYRDYHPAFTEAVRCLDDPNSSVQAVALTWPWYRYTQSHPEILSKLRKLSHHPDARLRAGSCSALVSARDLGAFYNLWWRAIFDGDRGVRRSIHLDLLLESHPIAATFLLSWPTILAALCGAWLARWKHTVRLVLRGVSLGYLTGAVSGVALGALWTTNPFIHMLFLMPAVCVPVALVVLVLRRYHLESLNVTTTGDQY